MRHWCRPCHVSHSGCLLGRVRDGCVGVGSPGPGEGRKGRPRKDQRHRLGPWGRYERSGLKVRSPWRLTSHSTHPECPGGTRGTTDGATSGGRSRTKVSTRR